MAFTMANKAFEEIFGEGKIENGQAYTDFMDMLREYLSTEKGRSAKKIAAWIKRGGALFTFTCRQDAVEPLCDNLTAAQIPYIIVNETSGKMGFLIREADVETAKKTAGRTLAQMSRYCMISNGEDTGFTYLKEKDEDKTMLTVAGFSREEAFFFAETAKNVLPGEKVGIDHMPDGTYMITVHAKTAMRLRKKDFFPEALAETVVLMNGETRKEMQAKVAARLKYITEKEMGFPSRNGASGSPVWIVGGGNCFVKISGTGPEAAADAGHAVVINDSVILETDYSIKKDDRKYKRRLNSALSRITGHKCLYSIQDVLEHFRNPKRFMTSAKAKGQQAVIRQAAEIVAQKVGSEKLTRMDGRWEHKFRHFQKEMRRVIEGAAFGKVPKGYSRADIIALRETAEIYGVSLKFMVPGIKKYAELGSYAREAGKQRVTDLEQLITRYGGEQTEEKDVSRDVSRGSTDSPGSHGPAETR